MISLKNTLEAIKECLKVDYIVEQGTSDNWKYKKWNSGIIECWITQNLTVNLNHNVISNIWMNNTAINISYPSIVLAINTITTNGNAPTQTMSAAWWVFVSTKADTTNKKLATNFLAWSSGGNQTLQYSFQLIGTWK